MHIQEIEYLGEYDIPPSLMGSLLSSWYTFSSIKKKHNISQISLIYEDKNEKCIELKIRDLLFFSTYRYIRFIDIAPHIIQTDEIFAFRRLKLNTKKDFQDQIDNQLINRIISSIFIILNKANKSAVYMSFLIGSEKDNDIINNSKLLLSELNRLSSPRSSNIPNYSRQKKDHLVLQSKPEYHKDAYFDPYLILEIPYGASIQEIKKAFRKKVKEFHPDLMHTSQNLREDSVRRFLKIKEAYEYLMRIKDDFYTV